MLREFVLPALRPLMRSMLRPMLGGAGHAMLPLALLCTAATASAQYAPTGLHGGTLEIPVNKSQIVSADRPIAKAMIGSPEIADIVPLTDRSVYVLGKGMGTTSLTLYDGSGRVLTVMNIAVGPDAETFREQVARLIPGAQIDAQISGDSLVLTGLAYDAGSIDRAMQLARTYAGDKVVNMIGLGASQQVMLEVRFAEVSRTIGEELGVSGFGISDDGDFRGVQGRGANLLGGALDIDPILGKFGVLNGLLEIGDVTIDAYLDTLESKGLSRTLAKPTLVALSGETASFLAGGEFPIPVAQSGGLDDDGGATITVEFKPFGVSLSFTPTVLSDKTINLVVEQGVSAIDPSASVTVSGLTVPGLQTRRANTVLELRDGESFAIAGLLRDETTTSVQGLPFLSSLPILGSLFRSSQYQKGQTELLIVVTPRLVQPIRPDQVRLPTDRIADPHPADVLLNGDDYQPQTLPPAQSGPSTEVSDYEL